MAKRPRKLISADSPAASHYNKSLAMSTPYFTLDEKKCDERTKLYEDKIYEDYYEKDKLSDYEHNHLLCLLLLSERLKLIMDAVKRHGEM